VQCVTDQSITIKSADDFTFVPNLDLRDAIRQYEMVARLQASTLDVIHDAQQYLASGPPHCEAVPHIERMARRAIELVRASQLSGPSSELHSTALALADLAASCVDGGADGGRRQ